MKTPDTKNFALVFSGITAGFLLCCIVWTLATQVDAENSEKALSALLVAKDKQIAGAFECGVAYGALLSHGQPMTDLHKEANAALKRQTKIEWTQYLP